MNYVSDVGALARKDLLLELRARDTLPAMLLFVASALVIFHFALPSGTGKLAGLGLLWVAIVFTALLDRELAALAGDATFLVSTHDPERLAPLASGSVVFA